MATINISSKTDNRSSVSKSVHMLTNRSINRQTSIKELIQMEKEGVVLHFQKNDKITEEFYDEFIEKYNKVRNK